MQLTLIVCLQLTLMVCQHLTLNVYPAVHSHCVQAIDPHCRVFCCPLHAPHLRVLVCRATADHVACANMQQRHIAPSTAHTCCAWHYHLCCKKQYSLHPAASACKRAACGKPLVFCWSLVCSPHLKMGGPELLYAFDSSVIPCIM